MDSFESIENISACFSNLQKEEIDQLFDQKTRVSFYKGETVFKQGAFAPHVLFINSGLVLIFLQLGKDKQVNIRLAKQGDYLAFSTVFNENTYRYSALALNDSSICQIDKEALKTLMKKNYDFAFNLMTRNSYESQRYMEIIKNISYKQMRGKLASALLYLSSEEFQNEDVFKQLTRQDIANFSSITVESTVKFLKEFEKDGLIKLSGKDILIKDYPRLKDIELRG
jgi:CRP/FNR family transcriptional regulator